jgi:hypothetical protein
VANGAFSDSMPDNCPPPGAEAASGEVFRIVKNDPLAADDFLTWFEEDKFDETRACECHGLSVFRNRDDAASYAEKFPYLGELVAKGSLEHKHGMIAHTPRYIRGAPNSHATWWPYNGLARHLLFVIDVEE